MQPLLVANYSKVELIGPKYKVLANVDHGMSNRRYFSKSKVYPFFYKTIGENWIYCAS